MNGGNLTIEAWALAAVAGVIAIVGLVIKVLRWLRREFVPRDEYTKPAPCAAACEVLRRDYMPRTEIERELRHRADRTHELANVLSGFQGQVRRMEHELTVLGVIVRSIAKNLGVEVPNSE